MESPDRKYRPGRAESVILFPTFEGVQGVDLNGNNRGSLYQDFPTISGQQYALTFAYADNPIEGGVSSADIKVTDLVSSGALLTDSISHSTSTNSGPNGDWIVYSSTFQATGTSTRLLFTSTSASDTPSGGILLDNVSVLPVPEPSTFALLGSSVLGLGFCAWRRHRV
jgi:hypothetical protein